MQVLTSVETILMTLLALVIAIDSGADVFVSKDSCLHSGCFDDSG